MAAAAAKNQAKQKAAANTARAYYLDRDTMAQGMLDYLCRAGKPHVGLMDVHDPDWRVEGCLDRLERSARDVPAELQRWAERKTAQASRAESEPVRSQNWWWRRCPSAA